MRAWLASAKGNDMEGMGDYAPMVSYINEVLGVSPFTVVDIGCSGGIHPVWRQSGRRLHAFGIDPSLAEIGRLRKAETHSGVYYVAAYAGLPAEHPFLEKKRDNSLDSADFLKIDIDGKDFDVLNSFNSALDAFGILGLQLEVNFFGSALETDHSFYSTDRFMKARGFELFDLTGVRRYSLSALPSKYLYEFPAETESGRILQGDALYLRDLGCRDHREFADRLRAEKLLDLICLFALFNLVDCAAGIAVQFRDRLSSLCDIDYVLDWLTEQAQGPEGHHQSYRELMERFEVQDDMFFPARFRAPSQKPSDEGNWLASKVRRAVRRVAGSSLLYLGLGIKG